MLTPLAFAECFSCCVVSDFYIIRDGMGVIGGYLPELQCVGVVSDHDIDTRRRGGCS